MQLPSFLIQPVDASGSSSDEETAETIIPAGPMAFYCELCMLHFPTKLRYLSHVDISHLAMGIRFPDTQLNKCHACQLVFEDRGKLRVHFRLKHKGRKPFACGECGQTFKENFMLKTHLRIHTGAKPYSCKQCGKRVQTLTALKTHNRVHTDERPYECKLCNKFFKDTGGLSKHRQAHANIRPFSCEACNKAFPSRTKLHRHNLGHTGERAFACDVCGKAFYTSTCVSRHRKTHV